MVKSFGKFFAFIFSLLLLAQVVSALSLVPGGAYPRSCPVVVQDSPGSSFRVYTTSGGYTGLSGTVSSTGYGAFQMTSAIPYNNYIVRANGVSRTFQLTPSASCSRCFVSNSVYTDGQVNPSNSNQYCDVSAPWAWQTRVADSVVLTPGTVSDSLVFGQEVSFTAVAYDEDDAVVSYPVEWSFDGDAVELASSSGDSSGASALFRAARAGSGYVVARVGDAEARVRLRVSYGALDEIELRLSPDDSEVRSGESVRVFASGFDEDGNAVPVSPSWSLAGDSRVGRLSFTGANASFTGLKVGSVNVSASSGSVSARVRLDVVPGNVSSAVVLLDGEDVDGFLEAEAGSDYALSVEASDASNNLIDSSDLSFDWNGGSIGSFDDAGEAEVVFTARELIGSGNLSVRVRGERGESVSKIVAVRVYPAALDGIRVSPGGEVSMVSGGRKNFSVIGFDEFGNTVSLRGNPSWTASPAELGRFTGSGMNVTFRADAAVDGEIIVSSGGFSDSVSVSVSPGAVDSVALLVGGVSAGDSLVLEAGASVDFSAVARDNFGNDASDGAAFSWTVSPSTLGSVNADDHLASFTARELFGNVSNGSLRVSVPTGGRTDASDSVNIQLVAGPLDEVLVSPSSVDLRSGERRNFTATGSDEFGNPVSVSSARWTVASGLGSYSESVGSVYSFVSSRVGSGRVTASVGGLSDYADVEVSPGVLSSIVVSSNGSSVPSSFSVVAGSDKSFSVRAFDAGNNLIDAGDLVFSWRSNVGAFDDAGENETVFTVQERAPASGSVNVSVRDGTISRNASFAVSVSPGSVSYVELSPDSIDELVVGSNQSFSARAFDEFDNLLTNAVFAWRSNGGSFNSSSGSSVLFVPSVVGLVNVSVSSGSASDFVSFDVVRRVSSIEILLNGEVVDEEVEVVAGESIDFDAVGFDDGDNEVEVSGVNWSVSGVGSVGADGVFSSTVSGASVVVASVDGFSDDVDVVVSEAGVSRVEVYRGGVLVVSGEVVFVAAGSDENFSARAFDSFGNEIVEDLIFSWSSEVGEFADAGESGTVFTVQELAPVNGSLVVSVSDGSGVANASFVVSVLPAVLDKVELYSSGELVEDVVELVSGSESRFEARGFDVFENEVQLLDADWRSGIGIVRGDVVVGEDGFTYYFGVLAAGAVGNGNVSVTGTAGGYAIGSQVSASDSVEVSVVVGAPTNLSVNVVEESLLPGGESVVYALLFDAFGNPVAGEEVSFELLADSLEPVGSLSESSAVTGEDGVASVVLTASSSPAGGVHVVKASFDSLSANDSVSVLSLFAFINGTVSGVDGVLEGAGVDVYSFGSNELVDSAVSNASGSFEFSELLNGSYYIAVSAEDYVDFVSGEVVLAPNESVYLPISLEFNDSVASVEIVGVDGEEIIVPLVLVAGENVGLRAVGFNSVGGEVSGLDFAWSVSSGDLGSIVGDGDNASFAASQVLGEVRDGEIRVVEVGSGLNSSLNVSLVPARLDRVDIYRDGAVVEELIDVVAGSEQQFEARGFDSFGNEVQLIDAVWSVDSGVGEVSSEVVVDEFGVSRYYGLFDASESVGSGNVSVVGTAGGYAIGSQVNARDVLGVRVVPASVASVVVSPSNASVVAGVEVDFDASVFDEFGNVVEGAVVTWSASGGSIDSASGVFVSSVGGEFVVTASVVGVSGNVSVLVLERVPASIIISPSNASVVAGAEVVFNASVLDEFGSVIEGASVEWSSSGGVVDSSTGVFSSNVSGEFAVFASASGLSGNASVAVLPGTPSNLGMVIYSDVHPYPGAVVSVIALLADAFGNPISGEEVSFDLVSSPEPAGSLSELSAVTGEDGVASVVLTASSSPAGGVHVVKASFDSLSANDSVSVLSLFVFINGTVSGVSGPLEGAKVDVHPVGANASVAVAFLNSSGYFVFDRLLNGSYYLVVSAEHYYDFTSGEIHLAPGEVFAFPAIELAFNESVVANVSVSPDNLIVAAGELVDFNASILDEFGNEVEGAVVEWSSDGGTIDANGVFNSTVAGDYVVTASIGGVSGNASVSVSPGAPANLSSSASVENVLPVGESVITVRVVDAFGNVVEGVEVLFELVSSPEPFGSLDVSSAVTNESGETSVVFVASLNRSGGEHVVSASVGSLSVSSLLLVVSNATVGSLEGVVSSNGSALEGALVEVVDESLNVSVLNATTNASGNYYFAEVEPGVYSVYASLAGFVAQVVNGVSVAAGLPSIVDFELAEFGGVNGFATDSYGNVVEGVSVSVEGFEVSTVTLADGGYSLLLAPGVYNLSFSKDGFESARVENVVVLSGESAQASVVLRAFGGISGFVVDAMTDERISGATVTVFEAGTSNVVAQMVSVGDGTYSFVIPAGVYDVQVDTSTASVDYGVQVAYARIVDPGASLSLVFPFI